MIKIESQLIKKSESKKTIALDFDGVLHSFTSGWTGPVPTESPVDGSKEFVLDLIDEGYDVCIFSARADTKAGKDGIVSWLKEHDFPDMDVYHEKPTAEVYVDDRGYRFEGKFGPVLEFIRGGTEPWYY